MATDVLNHVSPTMEWQESDRIEADHGGRRLPTAAEVMTVTREPSIRRPPCSARGASSTASTISTWS